MATGGESNLGKVNLLTTAKVVSTFGSTILHLLVTMKRLV